MINLSAPGETTSSVEVTHVSQYGIWLLARDKELFLPYEEFPWFREASIAQILSVEELMPGHFYWPELDIDLSLDAIENPERFPLKARAPVLAANV